MPWAEVVALADPAGDRAARVAAKWGVPTAFAGFRDLLAMPSIDAVHVRTPPFTHAETAIAALESDKHVYVV